MKGYSKMKIIHSPSHSRSKGVSDHSTSPEHQTTSSKKRGQEPSETFQESSSRSSSSSNEIKNKIKNPFLGFEEDDQENRVRNEEEILASSRSRLKRNSSVSAASTSIHSAMKKAFSMRRSTSVSITDRYCRIHDQSSALPSPSTHHDHHGHDLDHHGHDPDHHGDLDVDLDPNPNGDHESKSRSVKKKNTRSRILKACKKLIGK